MKVLVIGGGGREHALVWKLSKSSLVDKIYCTPGNAGISKIADCVDISSDKIDELLDFAKKTAIDVTIVGPEAPLVNGIVDIFSNHHLKIFGPTREAAELEGSKAFCRNLLRKYGIPAPNFRIFNNYKAALSFIKSLELPIVIKADGLAAGKGTLICTSESEAVVAIEGMMEKKIFGKAGEQIVVEEFLSGVEVSIIAFTDGKNIAVLESSQDHKRVFDNDKGPNTGGMGAYSPASIISEKEYNKVIKEVLVPVVYAMNKERHYFKGILYAGIMFTKIGPKVLEFNVRFGDPETQPLMLRLKTDLMQLILATIDGNLDKVELKWDDKPALCVVMASNGYPGSYKTGYEISGLDKVESLKDVIVFHAGTTYKNGEIVTSGGRVLGVTALGDTLKKAQANAYNAISQITFEGAHFRKDIGSKAI